MGRVVHAEDARTFHGLGECLEACGQRQVQGEEGHGGSGLSHSRIGSPHLRSNPQALPTFHNKLVGHLPTLDQLP